jgi:hypothetical protein
MYLETKSTCIAVSVWSFQEKNFDNKLSDNNMLHDDMLSDNIMLSVNKM